MPTPEEIGTPAQYKAFNRWLDFFIDPLDSRKPSQTLSFYAAEHSDYTPINMQR